MDTMPDEEHVDDLFKRYFGKSPDEHRNRRIHRELTPAILEGIPDADLAQAIRDFTLEAIGGEWVDEPERIPALGPGFAAAFFTDIAEGEILNGGFHQLFYNCGRKSVVLAKAGAELLEAHGFAALLGRALEIEERERPRLEKIREAGSLDVFFESYQNDPFTELEDAFSQLDLKTGVALVRLVRIRPELFCGRVKPGRKSQR